MKKVLKSLFLTVVTFSLFSCMTTNQVVSENQTEDITTNQVVSENQTEDITTNEVVLENQTEDITTKTIVEEEINIEDTQLDSDVAFIAADIKFPEYREINNRIEFKSPSVSYTDFCRLYLERRENPDDLFYTIISISNVKEDIVLKDLCIEKGTEYEYRMTVKDKDDNVLYESDILKITPTSGFGKIKLAKPLSQTYDPTTGLKKLNEKIVLVNPYEKLFKKLDYGILYILDYNYGNRHVFSETIVNERDLTKWVWEEYLEKPLVLANFYMTFSSGNINYNYQLPLESVPNDIYTITVPDSRIDFSLEATSEGNKITIPYNKDAPYFSILKKKNGYPIYQYINNFDAKPMTRDLTIIDSFVEKGATYRYSFVLCRNRNKYDMVAKSREKTIVASDDVKGELSFSVKPVVSFEDPNMVIKTLPVLNSHPNIDKDDKIRISLDYGGNEFYGENILSFDLDSKKDVNVKDLAIYDGDHYLSYVTIELKDKDGITYYQVYCRDDFSDEDLPKFINIQR